MTGDNKMTRNKVAYAIVEFTDKKWVQSVRRGIIRQWMHDKLLKCKTLKDQKAETFQERTVILQGFPSHMTSDELARELCKFGAITSIEAPTIDAFVEAQKEEKGLNNDYFSK